VLLQAHILNLIIQKILFDILLATSAKNVFGVKQWPESIKIASKQTFSIKKTNRTLQLIF